MPDPDYHDSHASLPVIGGLDKVNSLLGEIRNAALSDEHIRDGLRIRNIEVALAKLLTRSGAPVRGQARDDGMLAIAPSIFALCKSGLALRLQRSC